jgi:hypothetical protein
MSGIFFLYPSQKFTGLCNQLYTIISTICSCINNQNIIIIDNFLQEIHTNNYLPISEVLDLEKTNIFLEKYNIALIDGSYTNDLNIINAIYGTDNNFKDVTNIVKQFLNDNRFVIDKNININILFGDHLFKVEKKLKINFSIENNNKFTLSFPEKYGYLTNDVNIDFRHKNYIFNPLWHLLDDPNYVNIANDIFKNLHFSQKFINESNEFIEKISLLNNNINVIHLRLEEDGIEFWSVGNNLSHQEFKRELSNKYIHLIQNCINKEDNTIILSYSIDNDVINYLKNNGYNYFIHKKIKNNNRELNAIVDLLNSKHCNNIFIGVIGSTYSATITKIINPKIIKWINIMNLNN